MDSRMAVAIECGEYWFPAILAWILDFISVTAIWLRIPVGTEIESYHL